MERFKSVGVRLNQLPELEDVEPWAVPATRTSFLRLRLRGRVP